VCSTAPDGLVGRSRATGAVTWRIAVTGSGKNVGLVVDAADERAMTSSSRVLRAANLRTGKQAWTHRLPADHSYLTVGAADGVVYALKSAGGTQRAITLAAFRASSGAALWQRAIDADLGEGIAAFGGRVYVTDGTKVTARDTRSGTTIATSPSGTRCPHLIAGGNYLVCTGSPLSAEDTFQPLRRLDPATLAPLPTAEDTGMKPERGLISPDGVLMLFEESAEDPGAGTWNAYDLEHRRRLWSYATSTKQGGLVGGRFVTFTPDNDTTRGRLVSIDLHAGPDATGAAAPRMSARYPQTAGSRYPALVAPGGGSGHVVVEPSPHHTLRSIPLP
jgi:hypothetical protein